MNHSNKHTTFLFNIFEGLKEGIVYFVQQALRKCYSKNSFAFGYKGVYNSSRFRMTKRKFDLAIKRYTRLIEADREDNRGIAYLKKGRFDLALLDFNRAIEIRPDFTLAYINRGTAHQEMGHYDLSIRDFNRAIELEPDNSMAFNNRGFTYVLIGDFERARKDLERSLELSPDNIYALNSMAELYAAKNDPDEACRWLTKAIEKGYNNLRYLRTSRTYEPIRNAECFRKILRDLETQRRSSKNRRISGVLEDMPSVTDEDH
jgi:tetratricopeptide (TPR) repeat protein